MLRHSLSCKVSLYFRDKANELAEVQLAELSSQLEAFQTNLETFAREHKEEIKKDPKFRKHFQVTVCLIENTKNNRTTYVDRYR